MLGSQAAVQVSPLLSDCQLSAISPSSLFLFVKSVLHLQAFIFPSMHEVKAGSASLYHTISLLSHICFLIKRSIGLHLHHCCLLCIYPHELLNGTLCTIGMLKLGPDVDGQHHHWVDRLP